MFSCWKQGNIKNFLEFYFLLFAFHAFAVLSSCLIPGPLLFAFHAFAVLSSCLIPGPLIYKITGTSFISYFLPSCICCLVFLFDTWATHLQDYRYKFYFLLFCIPCICCLVFLFDTWATHLQNYRYKFFPSYTLYIGTSLSQENKK